MGLSLNWTLALIAAVMWAASVGWYLKTFWGRRKASEDKRADKEAAITAWSEARTLEVMGRFPRSAGPATTYAWQYSLDGGKTWIDMPKTTRATTNLVNVAPKTTVHVRFRALLRKTGYTDWSDPVSIIVI